MTSPFADWDLKINDGTDIKRLRLHQTEQGKSWVKREESVTPRVSENAASLETTSLPAERTLAFAMNDWHWGGAATHFGPDIAEPGHVARYQDGRDIDTSDPNLVKHGPKASNTASFTGDALDAVEFDDKPHFLTDTRLYSWTSPTLTEEDATGAGTFKRMEAFGGNLYIAAGTKYYSWNGSTLTEVKNGAASLPTDVFVRLDAVMWRAHSTNKITRSTNPGDGTEWLSPDITVGDGDEQINNMFVISGLLFVITEATIYAVDANDVPHEINKRLRHNTNAGTGIFVSDSGGDAWLVNDLFTSSNRLGLLRILAEGFEEFRTFRAGPFVGTRRKPVDFVPLVRFGGFTADFDEVFLAVSTSGLVTVWKGSERGGDEFAWTPFVQVTGSGFGSEAILVSQNHLYIVVNGTLHDFLINNWSKYASTWIMDTAFFNVFPTWDKIWFRIEAIVDMVGAGSTATLEVLYKKDEETSFTSIGTISTDGKNTLALPGTDQLVSSRIQLRFKGTSGNSDNDGIDLRAFSLEGALRPEELPLYDFTVVAKNDAEAAFLEGLRTKTGEITLTDPWGDTATVFVLPGFPVQGIRNDSALRGPQRVYRVVAQKTPPTS